jgi:hypothetical protein
MAGGAALTLQFRRGQREWRLTTGEIVSDEVAKHVIAHLNVVGCGDSLFRGAASQTFRYVEP